MPDVTWHPVDETPPEHGFYWVCGNNRRPQPGQWRGPLRSPYWMDCLGCTLLGVTHWAPMEFPAPPEEA